MSDAYEKRVKPRRDELRRRGMVRKELWVWPSVWKSIQDFAAKRNADAEVSHAPKMQDTTPKKTRG